jgi:arylsulfatase A-like enzyme
MSDQPNILFIVSDQMVAALTGAYGHPVVQTPHLSRLTQEGVRFDSAYTPFPLCSPGRACIMTGRHASEIGAWDNGALLPADQPTFAHYMDQAGYDAYSRAKCTLSAPTNCTASAAVSVPTSTPPISTGSNPNGLASRKAAAKTWMKRWAAANSTTLAAIPAKPCASMFGTTPSATTKKTWPASTAAA